MNVKASSNLSFTGACGAAAMAHAEGSSQKQQGLPRFNNHTLKII